MLSNSFLTKNETNIVVHNTECPNVFGAFSTFSVDNYWPDIEWSLNEQQKGQNIDIPPFDSTTIPVFAENDKVHSI